MSLITARLASVLLCLTLLSTYLLSGMLAKYGVVSESSGAARVAKFEIIASDVEGENSMLCSVISATSPGETVVYKIEVTNASETAVSFDLTVKNKYNNLPVTLSLCESGSSSDDTELSVLSVSNDLDCDSSCVYELSIDWPAEQNDPSYSGKVDIIVLELTAVQID